MVNRKKTVALLTLLMVVVVPFALLFRASTAEAFTPSVSVQPSAILYNSPSQGARFDINITIANVSNCGSVQLTLDYNGSLMFIVGESFLPDANLPIPNWETGTGYMSMNTTFGVALSSVNPVAIVMVTFELNSGYGLSAMHIANLIVADASGNIIASNSQDGSVEVDMHDVAITSITASSYWGISTNSSYDDFGDITAYSGGIINVTVVASNLGFEATGENFTVTVYHNSTLATFNVVNLQPGQNFTETISWNTSDVAAGNYYVIWANTSIIPYNIVTNTLLVGPTAHVKLIGDVNGDDKVDINDLIAWDAAYGSTPGSPNWNAQADINGDGIVDKQDGLLIIENYHS
jgi:hypothetical protein